MRKFLRGLQSMEHGAVDVDVRRQWTCPANQERHMDRIIPCRCYRDVLFHQSKEENFLLLGTERNRFYREIDRSDKVTGQNSSTTNRLCDNLNIKGFSVNHIPRRRITL